jgi:hypothetical protein
VFGFFTRACAYGLLLTEAYPEKVFGDVPGMRTWADAEPAAVPAGFGTPESVYRGPGAPPGYGYPGGFAAQAVAQPAAQPVGWLLLLPAAGKRLLVAVIVLGVIVYGANAWFNWHLLSSASSRADNVATAENAVDQVGAAYVTLTNNLTGAEKATKACDENLTCVTGQDTKIAGYLTAFGNRLTAALMPPNSVAARARLSQVVTKAVRGFTQLSAVTTGAQYQSVYTSAGLVVTLDDFDTDYDALLKALENN